MSNCLYSDEIYIKPTIDSSFAENMINLLYNKTKISKLIIKNHIYKIYNVMDNADEK